MDTLNKKPFFSVVIPLYNKEDYIEDTLKSVLNQTFQDFELIIVNDGSTDNSENKVKKIVDSRIKLFNQQNQGLSKARNKGITKASSEYIALIDADDFWYNHHLEQLYNLIKTYPNNGLYATGYTLQKSKKKFHRAQFNNLSKNFIGIVPDFFKHSLHSCVAWVGSICIPKIIFDDIGYFDPEIYSEQDTDLYIRIALKHKIVLDNTSVSSIYNRMLDDNMSNYSQKKTIPKLLHSYKEIESNNVYLKKYLDLHRFSTLIFFKLSSNKKLEKELKKDIYLSNLNISQRILIYIPNSLVRFLFNIKTKFRLNPSFIFKRKS